jgi:CheY-like chemotaxis protein
MPFFKVFKAENGLQAYKIAKSMPVYFFDAIVLDVQMPIMDGF